MELSNSQAAAAETIKTAVAASEAAARLSVDKALEAGRLLTEAKESAPHGTWLPLLERAGVHERQARRLMTLAASGLKSDTVSDLGGIKASLEWCSRFSGHSKQMRTLKHPRWKELLGDLLEADCPEGPERFIALYKESGIPEGALAHDLAILTEFFVTFREYGEARAGAGPLNVPYGLPA